MPNLLPNLFRDPFRRPQRQPKTNPYARTQPLVQPKIDKTPKQSKDDPSIKSPEDKTSKLEGLIDKGKVAKEIVDVVKEGGVKSLSFIAKVGSLFGYGEAVGAGVMTGGTFTAAYGGFKVLQYLYRRRKKKKKKESQPSDSSSTPTDPDDPYGSLDIDQVGAEVYQDTTSVREEVLVTENNQLRTKIFELENDASKIRKYIQVPIDRDVELFRRAIDLTVKQENGSNSALRFHKLVEEHFQLLKSGRGV